jgi:hypothetical protein
VTATFARFPETTFTETPLAKTNRTVASWSFAGERAAGFECSLNGGAFAPCSSPFAVTSFGPDWTSTLRVRGVDAAGAADPTPAEHAVAYTVAPLLRYYFEASASNGGVLEGYDGTAGSVTYPLGKLDKAIKFDGSATTGLTLTGTEALLRRDHQWTMSLWFREDAGKSNTNLLDFRTVGGWHIYHGVNGSLLTTCAVGQCLSFASTFGVWRHLVYRYAGESATVGGPLEVWLDGALVGTIANPDRTPMTMDLMHDIVLGADDAYWDGALFYVDDLRLYNAVYAPAEQCTRVMGGTWAGTSCTMP